MPEQPAIKRRGTASEADPIQMHPDVLSLCQIIEEIFTSDHQLQFCVQRK